jgi:hypothetical protein
VTRAGPQRRRTVLVSINVALKVAVAALLVFALLNTDWPRFASKAMSARAGIYPLLIAIPALSWLAARTLARRNGRADPQYPLVADILITIPFVVDLLGNAVNLYDSIDHFDDACHLVNWAILTGAVGTVIVKRRELASWVVVWLLVGFGAITAVLWEIGEYGAFVTKAPEVKTAYSDTIGDLTLGITGSLIAAILTIVLGRRLWSGRNAVTA